MLLQIAYADEIGKYLPHFPKSWRHFTIKQLAAHTSGLPNILSGRNALG